MMLLSWTTFCAASSAVVLLALAGQDLRRRRLPNKWVAAVAVFYLLSALTTPHALLTHGLVAFLALLLGMVLTAIRVMGGGDAKLIAAILLWAGPAQWWIPLVIATQVGLILAVLGIAARWGLKHQPSGWLRPAMRCLTVSRGIPYGVALAAGGLVTLIGQL